MRKVLFLLLAVALASLASAVLADEPTGELCTDETAALAPQTELEAPAEPTAEPVLQIGGEPCGGVICPIKQYCCNPTCNACLPFGMSCTLQTCNSTPGPSLFETEKPVTPDLDEQQKPAADPTVQ